MGGNPTQSWLLNKEGLKDARGLWTLGLGQGSYTKQPLNSKEPLSRCTTEYSNRLQGVAVHQIDISCFVPSCGRGSFLSLPNNTGPTLLRFFFIKLKVSIDRHRTKSIKYSLTSSPRGMPWCDVPWLC